MMHNRALESRFKPLVEDLSCPRAIRGTVHELTQNPTQVAGGDARGSESRLYVHHRGRTS
jgi:hypothetical protein